VFRATGDDSDEPKVTFSATLAGRDAKLVAMSGDSAAVALPEQKLLVLYGADGTQRAAYPLTIPDAELAPDPPGGVLSTSSTVANVYWFTGSKTMALNRSDLTPLWTLDGTLGPGVTYDRQLVVPIRGGLAVLDEQTGATLRTIGVDRHGYTGPVRLAALGPVLLEQRGDTLAALR
jgi:outer membrane protein assembly factor BamB